MQGFDFVLYVHETVLDAFVLLEGSLSRRDDLINYRGEVHGEHLGDQLCNGVDERRQWWPLPFWAAERSSPGSGR